MNDKIRQRAEDILTDENVSEELFEMIDRQADGQAKEDILLARRIFDYLRVPKFSFSNSEKEKLKTSILNSVNRLNRRRHIQHWTSVAAVLVLGILGTYGVYNRFSEPEIVSFAKNLEEVSQKEETRLFLQGGQEILIKNQESTIQYEESGKNIDIGAEEKVVQKLDPEKVVFNTVIVPFGRRSQITLCEGTKVWLNSGSKFVYPAVFEHNKREVYIEGEAIFEVTHAEEYPFFVNSRDFTVKVTGTIFNVCAYPDDANSSTVLERGKIELYSNERSLLHLKKIEVKPGEMVIYDPAKASFQQREINIGDYMSWRKGYYVFKREKLSNILKKISRYYNVEIASEKKGWLDETFTGSLDFRESPEEVLNLITKTLPFEYKSVNNKISIY